ncbi:hypothetical protein [Bacteroides reticulotermitis]|uniref:hypothetical protein n=1 Tax=Bacteroides reticulotermitis TaxID=1133319 RepID=UPI003A84B2C2
MKNNMYSNLKTALVLCLAATLFSCNGYQSFSQKKAVKSEVRSISACNPKLSGQFMSLCDFDSLVVVSVPIDSKYDSSCSHSAGKTYSGNADVTRDLRNILINGDALSGYEALLRNDSIVAIFPTNIMYQ